MSSVVNAVLFAAFVGVLAKATPDDHTPLKKVVTLLEGLKSEIEEDGKAEAAQYDKFSCFCRDQTTDKSTALTEGRDNVDRLSALISDKTETKETKEADVANRKAKMEEIEADLQEAAKTEAAAVSEFEALQLDLDTAVRSLESARQAMRDTKPDSVALIAMRPAVQKALALGRSMNLLKTSSQKPVAEFLQHRNRRLEPTAATDEYLYHSDGIIDVLDKLHTEFSNKLQEARDERNTARGNYEVLKQELEGEHSDNSDNVNTLNEEIYQLKSDVAGDRTNLVTQVGTSKDSEWYLKDLTALCEQRAKDWDQRSQMRADELKAITEALAILGQDVTEADKVNMRAVEAVTRAPTSFLQEGSVVHASVRRSLQVRPSAEQRQARALALLERTGLKLGSKVLVALAGRVKADPFAQLKELIQKLIERLTIEATSEVDKKGFCDTELAKETTNRDNRMREVDALTQEIGSLQAKARALEGERAELDEAVQGLTTALQQEKEQRAADKAQNLHTLEEARNGLKAVAEALEILRRFYKEAAKATSLLQWSPVDPGVKAAGFDGAYTGKQKASNAVIGLLEIIHTDFDRTIRTTQQAEDEAAAAFVRFERTSKSGISAKGTKFTLDGEDLDATRTRIQSKLADLKTNMDLVDSAVKVLEFLKPTCTDTGMSYADRHSNREQELAALREALCWLSPDADTSATDCAK